MFEQNYMELLQFNIEIISLQSRRYLNKSALSIQFERDTKVWKLPEGSSSTIAVICYFYGYNFGQ